MIRANAFLPSRSPHTRLRRYLIVACTTSTNLELTNNTFAVEIVE